MKTNTLLLEFNGETITLSRIKMKTNTLQIEHIGEPIILSRIEPTPSDKAAAIAFNSPQWDDTFEGKDRKAFLSYDDADQHEEGCRCGKCDANGTSHGIFVFAVPKEGCRTADDFDAAAEEQEKYPLSRIYAPSEEAALNNARLWCEMQGFEVIKRPNPPRE